MQSNWLQYPAEILLILSISKVTGGSSGKTMILFPSAFLVSPGPISFYLQGTFGDWCCLTSHLLSLGANGGTPSPSALPGWCMTLVLPWLKVLWTFGGWGYSPEASSSFQDYPVPKEGLPTTKLPTSSSLVLLFFSSAMSLLLNIEEVVSIILERFVSSAIISFWSSFLRFGVL